MYDTSWFSEQQKEHDYLQVLLLAHIMDASHGELVFKGGTALQKAYGLDRASYDLDFSSFSTENLSDIDEGIERLSKFCTIVNDWESERRISRKHISFMLRLVHPISKSLYTVSIDITIEKVLLEPKLVLLRPNYQSIKPFRLKVMDKNEILAEKVRAIMSKDRNKARDIYDLWFLINNDTDVLPWLIDEKLKYIGKRFSMAEFEKRTTLLLQAKHWNQLKDLVKALPVRSTVKSTLTSAFKKSFSTNRI